MKRTKEWENLLEDGQKNAEVETLYNKIGKLLYLIERKDKKTDTPSTDPQK